MVRVSTVILTILLALSAGYSIAVLVSPTMVLEGDSLAITGKSYQELLQPDAVRVALVHIRHMEVFALTATMSGFFIVFAGFRRVEKWAWWALLALGIVAWGYGSVLNLAIDNTFDSVVFLIGLVVFMLALFLPIRRFFPKTT
jgi:hypothetical protein